jgi:trigger factor
MNLPSFLPVPEVKYKQKTPILGEFEVQVHGSLMQQKMQEAFGRWQKQAKLPGFRPGKVPLEIVKKKFHEDVLHEVFNSVVGETYRKGAVENKVRVASEPVITSTNLQAWKEGENLQYTAQVDLIPEVKIQQWKDLPISKTTGSIGQEDVDVVLRNLLEPKSQLVDLPADTTLAIGHLAVIDFEGTLDGAVVAEASAKNFLLEMGGKNSLEEFQSGLAGMRPTQKRKIPVRYPEDYQNKAIAGKEVIYEVELQQIKQKNYPELTDEMAKEFKAETALELKARIRQSLEAELAQEQRQKSEEEVLLALLQANPLEVPPSLVQRQLEYVLQDTAQLLRKQRFGDSLIQDYFRKHSSDFEARAGREVRVALLLPKLIEEQKLKPSIEDYKAHFETLGQQTGQPLDAIEKFYDENKQRKEELGRELERRNALALLLKHAKVK